jgi:hypothetical protein
MRNKNLPGSPRFRGVPRSLTAALALTASTVLLSAAAIGTAQAATAGPHLMRCNPIAGTVISSKAISVASAWSPTNLSSNFITGPGTITYTRNATSLTGQQVSAQFSVDEGLLFVSAKETYGLTLQRSHSQTEQWSYAKTVPAGKTERLEQYHQSYEIGIRQTYMGYKKGGICHVYTEISKTGNFFPSASASSESFCWALTPFKSNRTEVGSLCRDL